MHLFVFDFDQLPKSKSNEIISKPRSAHAQAHYFFLGHPQDITTNQIHFEHDQI